MMKCILLLNRAAGGNERGLVASEVCHTVQEIFREQGHQLLAHVIDPERVEEEIKKAAAERPDAIIVGGGDGTVSTAAGLLGGTGIALGVLPMGTFNLAARDLGVPLDIKEAAEFLAQAQPVPIDVLMVSGRACLCTTVFGFYPEFSSFFEKRDHGGRWWRKTLKLAAGVPKIFARARPLSLEWKGEDATGHARTKFSAFVPGKYRSTTGIVPSRTDFRSGAMTGYIGTHRKASAAVKAMLDYLLGRHEENAELRIIKARSLELNARGRKHCTVMLDGEIIRMPLPIRLDILPERLVVLTTPEHPAETSESTA
ncbi:diacylglycerol kinase family protein [Luteolibacter sp. SL250]|uniref:diacylglycerol/lipid kinase family protein n=1 Tax=Luteolibacter sp. SL250 TaxID=2995170 RepID=UPI0022716064|nr:diacylglycerol kinase family protein [Luteolibacter sp. SL250]WAC19357.1 diacylglycerol kinase family protein [Luteolibacter sp. SL250]